MEAVRRQDYSRGLRLRRLVVTVRVKEPVSAISHAIGALLAAAALVVLVASSALHATPWHVVSFAVYGGCMVLVYLASAAYHWLPLKPSQEKLFRRIDHSMIYLMIAGSYTPIALVALRDVWGWTMLGLIWGIALYGIFNHWRPRPRGQQHTRHRRRSHAPTYIGMGWVALVYLYPIVRVFSGPGVGWLVAGGVAYTVGGLIYALKRPNPLPGFVGFHEVFHLFVMLGSFCHFWFMLFHVLPLA